MTLGPIETKHSPEMYVHICSRIHEEALGGFVQVQNGRHWRRLWWVAGSPVWFESNLPEEQLGASLVAVGLLDEIRLMELNGEVEDEEALRDVLLRHDDVPPDILHEQLRSLVARGVSGPLVWPRGDLIYKPLIALPAVILRSAVLAAEPPLQLLWHGAEAHVRMDHVLGWVSDADAGRVIPTDALAHILPALVVGTPLASLVDLLKEARTVDELFLALPGRSGSLIVLLWLVELAGLIVREGGDRRPQLPSSSEEAVAEPASKPHPPAASAPVRPPPRSLPGARSSDRTSIPGGKSPATADQIELAIRADHRRRINRDYYAFLGVGPDASVAELEARANKLVNRWMRPMKSKRTPPKARALVEELLGTVRLVWRTLSDEDRRAEYDRRMARGQAPVAGGGIVAADVSSITSGTHPTARKRPEDASPTTSQLGHQEAASYIERGQYERAAGILRRLRQENPSDPDVLADLGWAEWRCAKGESDREESAEDYVRLALTFHPDHARALEFLARIALDQKDIDGARGRLRAVLRVTPDARWARAALDAIGSEGTGGGRRR